MEIARGGARTGAQVWQATTTKTPGDMGFSSHFDEQTAKWDRMMRSLSNSTSVVYQFKKMFPLQFPFTWEQAPRRNLEIALNLLILGYVGIPLR